MLRVIYIYIYIYIDISPKRNYNGDYRYILYIERPVHETINCLKDYIKPCVNRWVRPVPKECREKSGETRGFLGRDAHIRAEGHKRSNWVREQSQLMDGFCC